MKTYDVIKRPLLTEKLSRNKDAGNLYAFEVDRRTNKVEIKQAVEAMFKVKVLDVHTVTMPGKNRRFGARQTEKRPWKKAIVKLKTGDRIELYEGV
jgi:large subunit ribosomal protein L23